MHFLLHACWPLAYTEIVYLQSCHPPSLSHLLSLHKMIASCIQVPPYMFEYRQIPSTALKYNIHERLRG